MVTIFTDFDGVLFDTIQEAYLLCAKAYYNTDFYDCKFRYFETFKKYKYLVYNSWQYYYLMKTINNSAGDNNFESFYKSFLQNREKGAENLFETKYLEARKTLLDKYPELVNKYETKFPFFGILSGLKNKYDIVVVSRTNRIEITNKINSLTGIKVAAKEELADFTDKSEYIEKYMKENNVEKAYFIDDNSSNIKPCENIHGLTCILAGWGNIAPNETGVTCDEAVNIILEKSGGI